MRTALIWLMALAMPLQGVASPSMQPCGPGHSGMTHERLGMAVPAAVAQQPHGGHVEPTGQHPFAAAGPPAGDLPARTGFGAASTDATAVTKAVAAAAEAAIDEAEPAQAKAPGTLPGDWTSLDSSSCSACASCCSALALPSRVIPLGQPELSSGTEAITFTLAASFLTDGLERPPRDALG